MTGPERPPSVVRPTRVVAGLAHRGDEEVIILIIDSPEFRVPVTVAITEEQARKLRAQLAAAMVELPPTEG